jgi:eukaryotic-like serine/threonine-protein kinase
MIRSAIWIGMEARRLFAVDAGSVIKLSLVVATLLMLSSCGSTPSTHFTPTASPIISNPYPPHQGTLVMNDSLHDNSRGYQWDEKSASCRFRKDGYHTSTVVNNYNLFCTAYATDFSNFAYEAEMTILKGDSGGLMLRADPDKAEYYYFRIDQTGYFLFIAFTGHTSGAVLAEGTTSALHKGIGHPNLIGIVAQGDHFTLYVNHQQVKTVTNSTFNHGQIGVVVFDYNSPAEVVFTDAKVWTL